MPRARKDEKIKAESHAKKCRKLFIRKKAIKLLVLVLRFIKTKVLAFPKVFITNV